MNNVPTIQLAGIRSSACVWRHVSEQTVCLSRNFCENNLDYPCLVSKEALIKTKSVPTVLISATDPPPTLSQSLS